MYNYISLTFDYCLLEDKCVCPQISKDNKNMWWTGYSETIEDIYAYNKWCNILVHTTNWYNNQSIHFNWYNYTIKREVGNSDRVFYDAFVSADTDAEAEKILYSYNNDLFQKTLQCIEQINSERCKQWLLPITYNFIHTPTSWFTIDASYMLAQYLRVPLISTIRVNEKELQTIETFKLPHSSIILKKDLETKQKSDLVICKNKVILEDTLLVNNSAIEINNDLFLPRFDISKLDAKNSNNILYVGRLSYEKWFDRFVELVKTINKNENKFNFYICGSSLWLDPKLWELIQELQSYNNVFLLWHISMEQLQDMYLKCWYVIIPSRSEAYCRVILEWLYYWCYIFATNVGSASSQITSNKYGKVIENSDASIINIINYLSEKTNIDYTAIHTYWSTFNNTHNIDMKLNVIADFLISKTPNDKA